MASEQNSQPAPDEPEAVGGSGGGSDPTIRDARAAEKAFSQRWPIDSATRSEVMSRLRALAKSEKPRTALAAARALIAAEAQNQADEHKGAPDPGLNLNLSPEELASMTDEELRERTEKLRRALGSRRS